MAHLCAVGHWLKNTGLEDNLQTRNRKKHKRINTKVMIKLLLIYEFTDEQEAGVWVEVVATSLEELLVG